jgi:hypothetical protein
VKRRNPILIVFAAAALALGLFAAQRPATAPAPGASAKTCNCPMMMSGGNMQQMQARMSQTNAQLDRDVAAMNKATGQAKVDAMAVVINDMAREHREMSRMMGGMGQNAGMRMGDCPMMSGSAPAKPVR